jgi:protein-L-isoaspartate O-methyltransferase
MVCELSIWKCAIDISFCKVGDGWKGLTDKSPFDAIHVGAAAERKLFSDLGNRQHQVFIIP